MWHNNKRRKRLAHEAEAAAAAQPQEMMAAAPRVTRLQLAAANPKPETAHNEPSEGAGFLERATPLPPARKPPRQAAHKLLQRTGARPHARAAGSGARGGSAAGAGCEDDDSEDAPQLHWPAHGRRMRNVVPADASQLPPLTAWQARQLDSLPAGTAGYSDLLAAQLAASNHYAPPGTAHGGWGEEARRTALELTLQARTTSSDHRWPFDDDSLSVVTDKLFQRLSFWTMPYSAGGSRGGSQSRWWAAPGIWKCG